MVSHEYFVFSLLFNLKDPNNNFCINKNLVRKNSKLLIDGYPGSGQSFLLKYTLHNFTISKTNIIHHTHSSIISTKASELGIPSVILIRSPDEAVYSLVSRWNYIPYDIAYKYYCEYYQNLLDSNQSFFLLDSSNIFNNNLSTYLDYLNSNSITVNKKLLFESLLPSKLKSKSWNDRKSNYKFFKSKILLSNLSDARKAKNIYTKINEIRSCRKL